eukprot:CAMPEP_0202906114 /NCGR_PEP_ID=MMETSP1392-20130828/37367_1 /ASSEMBLY_ACC=CAM_ASM_000868 /TAXON_ID=225041 /ORGANISM="Chlamydomonas chlamydogama, Strain SAG 11-48b" /LENGTH=289 /DNA_ID=CAMNT_0049594479 /DNA_START=307 /DNA_END=1177 /DNA_ORIENTATION=-
MAQIIVSSWWDLSSTGPGQEVASTSQATPAAASTASKEASKTEDEEEKKMKKWLEENKDMDLDGYAEYCRQMKSGSPSPRPRVAPVPLDHPDHKKFMDARRISYLRISQHEAIIIKMSEEEKELIKKDPTAAAKDADLLKRIAERTGVYIDLEVKDCIKCYKDSADNARHLYRWVVTEGKPYPKTRAAQKQVDAAMARKEEAERKMEKMAGLNVATCPMRPVMAFMGPDSLCSATGLKYFDCCGAQQQPSWIKGERKAKALEKERGRLAPRHERTIRKAMDMMKKRHFD